MTARILHSIQINNQTSTQTLSHAFFQPKLSINQPNDIYEKETDAVANNFVQSKPCRSTLPFFKPLAIPNVQQKALASNEEQVSPFINNNRVVQRQPQEPEKEQGDVTKPTGTSLVPTSKPLRTRKCMANPEFPDFGCFGQQLKLDIDENLLNNAHQFSRATTLFPGDSKLMLDTFLRYGIGKNLLETSFGFAGINKKWSSRLAYGTGIALKSYDLIQNGQLKLDIQVPVTDSLKIDFKLDINTNPNVQKAEEGFSTTVGVSGRF